MAKTQCVSVAAPINDGSISPNFGESYRFQFFLICDGEVAGEGFLYAPFTDPAGCCRWLAQQGVEILLIDKVEDSIKQMLLELGIHVISECGAISPEVILDRILFDLLEEFRGGGAHC